MTASIDEYAEENRTESN